MALVEGVIYLSFNLYILTEMMIDCIRPRQEFYEIQNRAVTRIKLLICTDDE